MTKKTLNLNLMLLVTAFPFLMMSDCGGGDDSCYPDKQVFDSHVVLEPNGTTWKLTGGAAKKDCHADFSLKYRWEDPERARNDSTTPPPLNWTFQTSPGMFYFPASEPVRKKDSDGWYWEGGLSIGAKDQEGDYVQYEIEAYAPDYASEAILIKWATIDYVSYPED